MSIKWQWVIVAVRFVFGKVLVGEELDRNAIELFSVRSTRTQNLECSANLSYPQGEHK